jgi:hypothetical protein
MTLWICAEVMNTLEENGRSERVSGTMALMSGIVAKLGGFTMIYIFGHKTAVP